MRYQIYVLNRAAEETRLEHFRIQAGRLRQSFVRVEALSADSVQVSRELEHYDEVQNKQHYYRALTMAEVATYLSHRRAWQRMLDDEIDFAIILEDDVLLANSFTYLARTIAQLEQPWHVLKLTEPYARTKWRRDISTLCPYSTGHVCVRYFPGRCGSHASVECTLLSTLGCRFSVGLAART